MKTDYRFWEHNLNPLTMKVNDNINVSEAKQLKEGAIQELDERNQRRLEKSEGDAKAKRLGKFW